MAPIPDHPEPDPAPEAPDSPRIPPVVANAAWHRSQVAVAAAISLFVALLLFLFWQELILSHLRVEKDRSAVLELRLLAPDLLWKKADAPASAGLPGGVTVTIQPATPAPPPPMVEEPLSTP